MKNELDATFEAIRGAFHELESKARAYARAKARLVHLLTGADEAHLAKVSSKSLSGSAVPGINPVPEASLTARIFRLVRDAGGPISNQAMIRTLKVKDNTLRGILGVLKNRGKIEHVRRGWWQLSQAEKEREVREQE